MQARALYQPNRSPCHGNSLQAVGLRPPVAATVAGGRPRGIIQPSVPARKSRRGAMLRPPQAGASARSACVRWLGIPRHHSDLVLAAARSETSRRRLSASPPLTPPATRETCHRHLSPASGSRQGGPCCSQGSHPGQPRLTSPRHGCVLARYGFIRTNRRPSGLPSRIILPSAERSGRSALRD